VVNGSPITISLTSFQKENNTVTVQLPELGVHTIPHNTIQSPFLFYRRVPLADPCSLRYIPHDKKKKAIPESLHTDRECNPETWISFCPGVSFSTTP
jgi:hypothetical protein